MTNIPASTHSDITDRRSFKNDSNSKNSIRPEGRNTHYDDDDEFQLYLTITT